jgi:hypothetical protein
MEPKNYNYEAKIRNIFKWMHLLIQQQEARIIFGSLFYDAFSITRLYGVGDRVTSE